MVSVYTKTGYKEEATASSFLHVARAVIRRWQIDGDTTEAGGSKSRVITAY